MDLIYFEQTFTLIQPAQSYMAKGEQKIGVTDGNKQRIVALKLDPGIYGIWKKFSSSVSVNLSHFRKQFFIRRFFPLIILSTNHNRA